MASVGKRPHCEIIYESYSFTTMAGLEKKSNNAVSKFLNDMKNSSCVSEFYENIKWTKNLKTLHRIEVMEFGLKDGVINQLKEIRNTFSEDVRKCFVENIILKETIDEMRSQYIEQDKKMEEMRSNSLEREKEMEEMRSNSLEREKEMEEMRSKILKQEKEMEGMKKMINELKVSNQELKKSIEVMKKKNKNKVSRRSKEKERKIKKKKVQKNRLGGNRNDLYSLIRRSKSAPEPEGRRIEKRAANMGLKEFNRRFKKRNF